jgi:zinc/manganese transport system permease protein
MWDLVITPFVKDPALARALWAGVLLAIATAPLGVFIILRRMSLIGDAFGHAILPGAAGAALLSGGATWAISLGAALTGTTVFISANVIGRFLRLPEDAGFALFFLSALAVGVLITSHGGEHVHLEELLFGTAMALDMTALVLSAIAMVASVIGMAVIYRPLMIDTIDPKFLSTAGRGKAAGTMAQAVFFALLALTSVASFHALGALMAAGLTIVPAIAARYLARSIVGMMVGAGVIVTSGVLLGLLLSHHQDLAAGASIIMSLVTLAFLCAFFGPVGSVLTRSRLLAQRPGSKVATSKT